MSDMRLYVLNLDRSKERRAHIEDSLASYDGPVSFVRAVDGRELNTDTRVADIFSRYAHLQGTAIGGDTRDDGTCESWPVDLAKPLSCFAGSSKDGHFGDKGLRLSNMIAMRQAREDMRTHNNTWACIAEDDAELSTDTMKKTNEILTDTETPVAWLDNRGRGGSSFVCYTGEGLDKALEHLHPLSDFSRLSMCANAHDRRGTRTANLWDWQSIDLWTEGDANMLTYAPLVASGNQGTTIQ